jgi:hypothetical protein
MVKVIETNISMVENEIKDFQSRVVEVDNWYDFVNEIKEGKTVIRNSIIGSLHGSTIPRESKIKNLWYDDFHLSCDIYNYHGIKTRKLAYLV